CFEFVLVHLLTHEGILLKKLLIRGRLHNWIYRLLQSGGPSVVREQMFAAFASIDRALSLLIKFLIAVKTLIEVLKSLNNYM
ncbi:hypothetical protein ACSZND_23500, partial [Aeromonas hydrophila]